MWHRNMITNTEPSESRCRTRKTRSYKLEREGKEILSVDCLIWSRTVKSTREVSIQQYIKKSNTNFTEAWSLWLCCSHNEFENHNENFWKMKELPDCMQDFFRPLNNWLISEQRYWHFSGIAEQSRSKATVCWISENEFKDNEPKPLDHWHYSRKFLG